MFSIKRLFIRTVESKINNQHSLFDDVYDDISDYQVKKFKWQVIHGYGFNVDSSKLLTLMPLTIKTPTNNGGGLTYWDHVELEGYNHEAALHEFCHWVWERTGLLNSDYVRSYIDAYEKLAKSDKKTNRDTSNAAAFAKLQLYGDNAEFPGILQLSDYDHAFVSLASYHMGQYTKGTRRLPSYMWPYFDKVFSRTTLITPYYEGGHV